MATYLASRNRGVSTFEGHNADRDLLSKTVSSFERRHNLRKIEQSKRSQQNQILIAPKALIPKEKQLLYRTIPERIRKAEGLKVYKGPFDEGLAAKRNRNNPKSLRKSTDYIIIHETSNEGLKGNLRIIPEKRSAHFFVTRKGTVYQTVPNLATEANHVSEIRTAWKQSIGRDMKERSIGIEFLGDPYKSKPTAAQYAAGKKLIRSLMKMYGIPSDRVLSHGMVSCDNPKAKNLTRGRHRDIDGAYYVSTEGRRKLKIGAGPAYDPNGARPGPYTKRIVYDPIRKNTTFMALKEDETLWRFSKRTGIPLETIYRLNKGIDPRSVHANDRIKVPLA